MGRGSSGVAERGADLPMSMACLDLSDEIDCGTDTVRLTTADGVATVRLNRPQSLNAMNKDLLQGFSTCLDILARRTDIRVVILTGTGRAFCAGGDMKDRLSVIGATAVDDAVRLRRAASTTERLFALPQVTLAAINGPCAGAGVAWAAACDLRFADRRAIFNPAYLEIGLAGDLGGAWMLSRVIGASRGIDWFLRPRRISSSEAQSAGFVTVLAEPEEFVDSVLTCAQHLSRSGRDVLSAIKANFRESEFASFHKYLNRETVRHVRVRHGVIQTESVVREMADRVAEVGDVSQSAEI
jgi:2-(1,2-epoxy-1,2-dihydrophenyl)acetyl-CoA isomerase